MDYGFFQAFEKLSKDVADLKTMVAALVDEGSDKAAALALAAKVRASTAALQDAIPK